MLTFTGGPAHRLCDGVSRRDFLQLGALGLGGLTLADLLRLRAHGAAEASHKAVISVYLPGGPSHLDMYDLKPAAPVEFRGEFKPIRTNVPGLDVCELMPLHAKMADKFAVLRGLETIDIHDPRMLLTGFAPRARRPVFGSVISRLRPGGALPPYVALGGENGADPGDPAYLGTAHKPFTLGGPGMANLTLVRGVSPEQLADRKRLLASFDALRRDVETRPGELAGLDAFTARALETITSSKVRDAFDVRKEPARVRERYGKATRLLQALRLVQAGVSVVTLSAAGTVFPGGDWDTHAGTDQRSETNFQNLRRKLPPYDQAVHALVTDLYERGLDKDVCVVIWGEFGRTPKINKNGGRDHWPPAGFVVFAGGGLKMGQVIGDTGPRAERARGTHYGPQNVLATLYRALGIDPSRTLPDHTGRPMYLLDERAPIAELV
jgi:uncharacterized protein (DUF1501 family)